MDYALVYSLFLLSVFISALRLTQVPAAAEAHLLVLSSTLEV